MNKEKWSKIVYLLVFVSPLNLFGGDICVSFVYTFNR